MLTDILSNKFGIKLDDVTNFSDGKVSTPVFFKYLCSCYTNDGDDDKVFDERSYVYIDHEAQMDIFFNKVIKYMLNDMYINRFPKALNTTINRFVTKVAINVKSLTTAVATFGMAITEANISNTVHAKKYILALHRTLAELDKYCLKFNADDLRKNSRLYIDLYDSVIDSSYITFVNRNTAIPLFSANSIECMTKLKDYQLSFSDKVDGVVSASFNANPFMLSLGKTTLLYDTIDGATMNVSNDKITIDYIGSIVDPFFVYNYKEYKSKLKLTFEPVNGKLFKNKTEFDKFNSFINYIDTGIFGQIENKLPEFPVKLRMIEISSNNNKENNPYIDELNVLHIFKEFIKTMYPTIDNVNKDPVIEKIINSDTIPEEAVFDKVNNRIIYISDENLPVFNLGVNFYYG